MTERAAAPLPHDEEAERATLGAVLALPSTWPDVAAAVAEEDFYAARHREVYAAISAVDGRGEVPDPVAVAGELRRRGSDLDPIDVADLAGSVPVPAIGTQYARTVARLGRQRRMIAALWSALERAQGDVEDPDRLATALSLELIQESGGGDREAVRIGPLISEVLEVLDPGEAVPDLGLVPSGFRDLDALLGGLARGQLLVVASRPGVGKSSLVANVARNVAGAGMGAAFFSIEMSAFEVVMRLLCAEGMVPFDAVRTGRAGVAEWRLLAGAADRLFELPLFVTDRPGLRLPDVRAMARRVPNLGLVVVDYLQLMSSARTRQNRQEEVADISRGLKLLARELGVPVLAACQLNRDPERRQDKRPTLADLRESGQIEQDADVVILLHREAKDPVDATAIVAKQRNGPTGDVELTFHRDLTRFVDRLI